MAMAHRVKGGRGVPRLLLAQTKEIPYLPYVSNTSQSLN